MAAIAYRTAICSHPKPWGARLPRSDPLYGLGPDTTEDYGANLGAMATRGERGTLIVSIDSLARMSSNPFFDYVVQRIEAGISSPAKPAP